MADQAKILLIEDDNMLREMYSAKFGREGYQVHKSDNGSDGVKIAVEIRPDIILLDIIMPKMDGFAALKELRKKEETQSIPVILLTNLGQDKDIEKGKKLGADDYFIKANHTPAEIVEKVREMIGK